jgi:dynein heavy chain, axonemal
VMLMRDNFFLELAYFDKARLSAQTAQKLSSYCNSPAFAVDAVMHVSVAAASVCQWLHALNMYSHRQTNIKPMMQKYYSTQSDMKRVCSFYAELFHLKL